MCCTRARLRLARSAGKGYHCLEFISQVHNVAPHNAWRLRQALLVHLQVVVCFLIQRHLQSLNLSMNFATLLHHHYLGAHLAVDAVLSANYEQAQVRLRREGQEQRARSHRT